MKKNNKRTYETPLVMALELKTNGFICTSEVKPTLTDPFVGFTEDPWAMDGLK